MDDSGGRNLLTAASQSPRDTSSTSTTITSVETIEPIAGTSEAADANVPQVLVDEIEGKLNNTMFQINFASVTPFSICIGNIYSHMFHIRENYNTRIERQNSQRCEKYCICGRKKNRKCFTRFSQSKFLECKEVVFC